ncbi:N,N-dimethylformamidase beta subunit family domain-containing protein [Natrialbaceae archaeon A-CW3]
MESIRERAHLGVRVASDRLSRRRWLRIGIGGAILSSGCLSENQPTAVDDGNGNENGNDDDDDDHGSEGGDEPGKTSVERSVASENDRDGDDGWKPRVSPSERPEHVEHLIEGYAGETSVEPGDPLEFSVRTGDDGWRYRIDVYRLGWYGGDGGRHATSIPSSGDAPGTEQPIPDPDPDTGEVACDWDVTDVLEVPTDWLSGLYLARFVLTSGPEAGASTAHPFVVRPHSERNPAVLVQLPLATAQAYNGWGGKSLYDHTSEGEPANVVSHDRPYVNEVTFHLNYAVHFLRFLEREGYDVAYVCDIDVHRDPSLVEHQGVVISAGHDEYWSRAQRLAFQRAVDAGSNVGFFGSNIAYWQVRYENDERSVVCYKHTVEDDPIQDERRTGLFRDVGLPECELLGVQGWGAGLYNFPNFTVQEEALDHPWMADTEFEPDDEILAVVGPEWDWIRDDCPPPGEYTNFFHYEEGTSDLEIDRPADADAVAYTSDAGGTVFSAGTLGYTRAIDPDPDWNRGWPYVRVREYAPSIADPDPRLQQFTRNLLDDFVDSSQ